jgi:hypothetical protein
MLAGVTVAHMIAMGVVMAGMRLRDSAQARQSGPDGSCRNDAAPGQHGIRPSTTPERYTITFVPDRTRFDSSLLPPEGEVPTRASVRRPTLGLLLAHAVADTGFG